MLLEAVYQAVNGNFNASSSEVTIRGIVNNAGYKAGINLDDQDVHQLVEDLVQDGLIRRSGMGSAQVFLTTVGRQSVESPGSQPLTQGNSPSIVISGNTGNVNLQTGNHNTNNQTYSVQNLPASVEDLRRKLMGLEGGHESQETKRFIEAVTAEVPKKFEIAAAAEAVAEKGAGQKSLLEGFGKGLAEGTGKLAIEGAVTAGTWLFTHGPIVLLGLKMLSGF